MTPEQFLNKWLPQAAEWLNVYPEALRMKDDLEAVIRAFNDEAGRCIVEENINWTPFVSRERGAELRNGRHGIVPPYDPESSKTYPLYTPDPPLNERPGTEEGFKEIGPDNWKFFGDYDSPSI